MRSLNPIAHRHERCRETRALMSDYLDGELGDERTAVERHLRWCRGCRRMLGNLSRTVAGLRRLRDSDALEHDRDALGSG